MTTVFLLGRILFGGFFIYNGYNHLAGYKGMTGYAKMKGVPMPEFVVGLTGLMLLAGGFSVLTWYHAYYGIIALLAFLVPTTYMMHQFWKDTDPMQKMNNRISFAKNVALIGALLMLFPLA